MNGARRLSSDTSAKINTIAVVLIVAAAGMGNFLVAYSLLNNNEKTYTVTVNIEEMEVANASGSVYNVAKHTASGDIYYNPSKHAFDPEQTSPSTKAELYTSITVGSKTNYTNTVTKDVQTSSTPVSSGTLDGYSVSFKVGTNEDSIDMRIFLLLKGSSPDASMGTVIDIYETSAGMAGVRFSVNLKDNGSMSEEFRGNQGSELIGYLKMTISVKS